MPPECTSTSSRDPRMSRATAAATADTEFAGTQWFSKERDKKKEGRWDGMGIRERSHLGVAEVCEHAREKRDDHAILDLSRFLGQRRGAEGGSGGGQRQEEASPRHERGQSDRLQALGWNRRVRAWRHRRNDYITVGRTLGSHLGSHMLTLSEAVLPPVFGPVMTTPLPARKAGTRGRKRP